MTIEITLLFFDGCPPWKRALENLGKAIASEHIQTKIHLLKIENQEQAQKERFLGSPSFRVSNVDLFPEDRTNYALNCRVYQTQRSLRGFPTVEMLLKKLRAILRSNA